jgi:inner membrane protein
MKEKTHMKGKTHAGIGAVTFAVLFNPAPGKLDYLGLSVIIFASVFPDIDHPKSIVNKYILPIKNKITKVTLYLCSGIIVLWFDYLYTRQPVYKAIGVSLILIALSSHRNGLTHSLTGMILFALIVGYVGNIYNMPHIALYFILGYGMHLICDMATSRGVPLFYPFRKKNVKLPITYSSNSKTASFVEDIIMIFGLFYIIYKFFFK